MEPIHYIAICHGKDYVSLPEEFYIYPGNKFIKITGLSVVNSVRDDLNIPYVLLSEMLTRFDTQNFISPNLTYPTDEETKYVTLSTTINNGEYSKIKWDYKKMFDIKLRTCYKNTQYPYDYMIELSLLRE